MADIIRTYTEQAPASRFIGIRYGEGDRQHGSFGHLWEDWFAHGRFKQLEALLRADWAAQYPEPGCYIGLMRFGEGLSFEYWIGLFLPPDTPVPDGYAHLDIPQAHLGVCWVKGQEPEIFWQFEACLKALNAAGHSLAKNGQGHHMMLERYHHQRFTQPDEAGNKILDQVAFVTSPALDSASSHL